MLRSGNYNNGAGDYNNGDEEQHEIPNLIRRLVYLDSLILENGQSPLSKLPPNVVAARRKQVDEQGQGIFIPPPSPTAFGIPENHPSADWVKRRLTPHPVSTHDSAMRIDNPVTNGRAPTYVACTDPAYGPLEATRQ
jgi:hypothetical protein